MIARFLRLSLIALAAFACVAGGTAVAREKAPKPAQPTRAQMQEKAFKVYVASLWPLAEARGVSHATFEAAFEGVVFNPKVVALAANQPEFTLSIPRYLGGAVTEARIAKGREAAEGVRVWLGKAERAYRVDPAVIMGVWGIETEFGAFCGHDSTVGSLASLAFAKVSEEYFQDELMAALLILEAREIAPKDMRGSWAGAMGQTQFMPSSYLAYAVDFEGHGKRDIWGSAADAVGSTAHYLAQHGWIADQPWGFEVRLPGDFALTDADSSKGAPIAAFAARGTARADGTSMPKEGEGRLLILAGLKGPVFLVTGNFDVIKSYNPSTAYALAVALLGDAIVSGATLQAAWPKPDGALPAAQVRKLQAKLKSMGYEVGKVDGKAGDVLRSAVRAWQEHQGLTPDGYADLGLFKRVTAPTVAQK